MLRNAIAFAAACSMAASPCLAADFAGFEETGARRSGAGVGAYLALPFGGPRSGRTQAGLRLTVSHDYRAATAQTAPLIRSDAFDIRTLVARLKRQRKHPWPGWNEAQNQSLVAAMKRLRPA